MGERGQTCSLEKGAGAAATAGTTRRAETRPTHDTSASFASLVRTRRTDRSRSSSRPDVHSQARCLDPPSAAAVTRARCCLSLCSRPLRATPWCVAARPSRRHRSIARHDTSRRGPLPSPEPTREMSRTPPDRPSPRARILTTISRPLPTIRAAGGAEERRDVQRPSRELRHVDERASQGGDLHVQGWRSFLAHGQLLRPGEHHQVHLRARRGAPPGGGGESAKGQPPANRGSRARTGRKRRREGGRRTWERTGGTRRTRRWTRRTRRPRRSRVIAPKESTRLDPSREGRDNPPEFDAVYF